MSLGKQICRILATSLGIGVVTTALGQTDESLLLLPWNGQEVVNASGDLFLMDRGRLESNHSGSSFFEAQSSGRFRLDTSRELNPTVGYDWSHIQTNDHSQTIPTNLDDVSVALASPLARVGDWFLGATVGFGYAGSDAFDDSRGWHGLGNLMMGTELSKDTSLVFYLDYDGNRTLLPDLPMPGFIYAGKWDSLHFALGFPNNYLQWTPTDQLKFSLDTYLFTSFDVMAAYKLGHNWKLYAKYVDSTSAFSDSDLPENRRLFYAEQRVESGIGYALGHNLDLEAGVGYAFARDFAIGFDELNLHRTTKVTNEPYARLGLSIHF